MQKFGGKWTHIKSEIVIKYVKAYLQIMKSKPWKLLYFDGFAGSGERIDSKDDLTIESTARQVLRINEPTSFDLYYFVELDDQKATKLKDLVKNEYSDKNSFVVREDCNQKLIDLTSFLRNEGKFYKALVFIDPFGMELKWSSIEEMRGLGIDLWILVPTGIGANRLLKNDGNISEAWFKKLESFLGISKAQILRIFYKKSNQTNLFGEEGVYKEKDSINKLHHLYKEKLNSVFHFVSTPFVLKNKRNSILFHFLLASNNANAIKIANEIIKPYRLNN